MANAMPLDRGAEATEIPLIVRCAIILGVIQSLFVLLVSLSNRFLEGTPDLIVSAILIAIGASATILLPGLWTRARTIDGIAAAAGIGLGAAFAFLVIDVVALQPLGTYTNRWHEVGGHSNWWYHPVWWMVGCYASWMGAWILANQTRKSGAPSWIGAVVMVLALTAVIGAIAAVVGFPGAAWGVGTFSVAIMPALALGVLISGFGAARD